MEIKNVLTTSDKEKYSYILFEVKLLENILPKESKILLIDFPELVEELKNIFSNYKEYETGYLFGERVHYLKHLNLEHIRYTNPDHLFINIELKEDVITVLNNKSSLNIFENISKDVEFIISKNIKATKLK